MTYLDILKKFDKALLTENIRLKKIYNQLVSESETQDFDLDEVEGTANDNETAENNVATETPKNEGIEVDAEEEKIGECGNAEDDSDVDLLMKESDETCSGENCDDKKKKELKEAKKFFEEMEHEDDVPVKEGAKDVEKDEADKVEPQKPGLTPEEFYKLKESQKKACNKEECDCAENGEECKCKDGECVGEDFMKPTSESCEHLNEGVGKPTMLPTQAWQVVQNMAKQNVELAFGVAGMYWWDAITDGKPEVLKDPACRKFNKLMGAERIPGDENSDPQFDDKVADKAKRRKSAAKKMLAFHDKYDGTTELIKALMDVGYSETLANSRAQAPNNDRGSKTTDDEVDDSGDEEIANEAELKPGKDAFADNEPKNVPADNEDEEKPVEKKSVADSLPEDGESALEEAADDQENPDVSKFFQIGDENPETPKAEDKPEAVDDPKKDEEPVKKDEEKPEKKEKKPEEDAREDDKKDVEQKDEKKVDESVEPDCEVPADDEIAEDAEIPSEPAEDDIYETEVVDDPEEEAAIAESIKNLVKTHKEMFS